MVIKAILDKVLTMGTVVNYKNILATLEDNVQLNMSLDEILSIASGYRKSMENFQQFYVEGEEVYIDEIYYYYVNPEERLRLSNILRAELELPEITIDEISTSANEPYYDTDAYSTDSSIRIRPMIRQRMVKVMSTHRIIPIRIQQKKAIVTRTRQHKTVIMKKLPMILLIDDKLNQRTQSVSGLCFFVHAHLYKST